MESVSHHNELVVLSQAIYDDATDKLTNYCAQKYCGSAMTQQNSSC